MSDFDSQNDELLVLESIYPETFSKHLKSQEEEASSSASSLNSGQVALHVQVPDDFHVFAPVKSTKEYKVKFLPPILFEYSLPVDYPSKSPPNFILKCPWLTQRQLSALCQKLDAMWAEQSGEVILFTWLKWIEDECLSFLKITSPFPLKVVHKKSKKRAAAAAESSASSASAASAEFVTSAAPRQDSVDEADSVPSTPSTQYTNSDEPPLPHSNNNNNTNNAVKLDPRATQDVLSISDLLKLVIDYDTLERERIFNQTYQTCSVCYNEKAGSLLMELYVCKHIFCRECLGEFFSVQLQEGNVKGMVCMDPECGESALPTEIAKLIKPDEYARYESLLLQKSLEEMGDIIYCPVQTCKASVIKEKTGNVAICNECGFAFCVLCYKVSHGVAPCPISDLKKVMDEYQNASPEEKKALEKRYGATRLIHGFAQLQSEEWLANNAKKCPKCGTHIRKIDGCNKMTCGNCHSYFCWICEKLIDKDNPYLHFRDGGTCNGKLFQRAGIDQMDPEGGNDNDDDDDGDDGWAEGGLFD